MTIRSLPVAIAFSLLSAPLALAQWQVRDITVGGVQAGDQFGQSVDIEGDRIAVGSGADQPGGAVRILERDKGGINNWGVVRRIPAPSMFGEFGNAISLSGDRVVINQTFSNTVFVHERNAGGADKWGQVAAVNYPTHSCDCTSVALDGDTIVVGLPVNGTPTQGRAYVYERDLGGIGNWGEAAELTAPGTPDNQHFGWSVAIDGDTVVVGGPSLTGVGHTYVFERDLGGAGNWGLRTELDSPADGFNSFGRSVALVDDLLVIGDDDGSSNGFFTGAAHIFERDIGAEFSAVTSLYASDAASFDQFGYSVAASSDGLTVAIGAWAKNVDAIRDGAAYVFERNLGGPDAWGELTDFSSPNPVNDGALSRGAVGVDGGLVVVGAYGENSKGAFTGAAYLLERDSPPEAYCTAGTSANGCQATLSLSGVPSATAATGFYLTADSLEGGANGLFFFGTNGRQANPWGNGTSYQCVMPPVSRGVTQTSTGASGTCEGLLSEDLNALWTAQPAKNPGAGAVAQAQAWYRDPQNTSNQTTSLSSAVEFTLEP